MIKQNENEKIKPIPVYDEILTATKFLPVLPLKNMVALPKSIIPVVVGRELSIKAVTHALEQGGKEVFLTAQKSASIENPTYDDFYTLGTRGIIVQVVRMNNGTLKILVEVICRAKMIANAQGNEFLAVFAQDLPQVILEENPENVAVWRNLMGLYKEYATINEKVSTDILGLFRGVEDLDYFADTVAVQLHLDFAERQKLLEMLDPKERSLHLASVLKNEIEILKAEKNIRKRVQNQVEKHQRDYYLNEQIRAIQRELGREDYQQEINSLRKKIKKNKLTTEAADKVESELKRLEQMQPMSPEATVTRNYIDWLINLPWHEATKDSVSLQDAETILDSSHASMKKAKERILEFLAARKFAKETLQRAPILCLVGPPGVGKTSLTKSVADALGRKMVRIALGGMRDEAEIRGHRRTYIGSMPGRIIQAMKKVGVLNPVILLDEIDKMSSDAFGDPSSALLEVLDPEQNKDFVDNFIEIGYDLSRVMFITTANVIDNIPYPLLDRMEIIHLSGYNLEEKCDIARNFLMPKLLTEHALTADQVILSNDILKIIVDEHTKEAGVRQLERLLAKVLRKVIQILLKNKTTKSVEITTDLLEKWLGAAPFKKNDDDKKDQSGVATGLAWTEVGGDVLEVEVSILKGKGGLTLTGQLGEVMQESAQAAMSYTRSRAKDLGLKENFYASIDVHVHVPEGSIPKDGPSAGITMVTALVSALTKKMVHHTVAMTGEVTLRGRVLPIGGIKEKLLAAIRFEKTKVIVPKANERDVKEIQNEINDRLKVVYVEHMDEVLAHALVNSPFAKAKIVPKKRVKKATAK